MSKMKLNPLASAILARRWPYAALSLIAPGLAMAAPSGGNVIAGQAGINASGNTTTIQQLSDSAVINWQDFSIGNGEYVVFNQSSASAAVLNKVIGGSPSEILGNLSANGRVYLVNPQGVLFGQGAQVNVGSLVATTMDIANEDFMQGRYIFNNAGSGDVINQGQINAAAGGFVVLAGDYAQNSGVISAQLGEVALVSGNAFTLDVGSGGLINVSVDEASLASKAGVSNAGKILAQGGRVLMTAKVARELLHAAVNNSGTISAQGITERGGDVYLVAQGGDIANNGLIDVSGHNGQNGGGVMIHSDADIELKAGSTIDITGRNGGVARIIASDRLNTAAGSLIDGRASDGKGGFTELSGHGGLQANGQTLLGQGGTLLYDPANICIANGASTCTTSSDSTIEQADIEASLGYGTSVYIVASDSITVTSGLAGNAIQSDGYGSLTLGIGYIDGYGGPMTGGFGDSPLQSVPSGDFVNSSAAYGSGSILFEGIGATRGGIDIAGSLYIKGATNKGDVVVGNIFAGSALVQAAGQVILGDVSVDSGNIELSSKVAFGVGNLSTSAYYGDIILRVLHSDTASSIGNLAASGDYGSICINDASCDSNYNSFAGIQPGYGDAPSPANIDLETSARTWAADSIIINNANITGTSLALKAEAEGFYHNTSITLNENATLGTGILAITASADEYSSSVTVNGATITANTLTVTGGTLNILAESSFSGSTATLAQTDDIYAEITESSFDYSTKLTLDFAGDLTISGSQFNSALQVTQPGQITGSDVSITAGSLSIADSSGSAISTLQAGILQLTATGGELQIKGGSQLTFNNGTLNAFAGESPIPVFANFIETESGGGNEYPYFSDPFNGAVSIGDYNESPDQGAAVLNYSVLGINAEGVAYIDNASLTGGALTVEASSLYIGDSKLTGSTASLTASGLGLGNDDPIETYYENSHIGSTDFDFTGSLSISVENGRNLDLNAVNINAEAGQAVGSSSVSLTSEGALSAVGLTVNAKTITLSATDGHLSVENGFFNHSDANPLPGLIANSSLNFSGESVNLQNVNAHASTIGVSSTLQQHEEFEEGPGGEPPSYLGPIGSVVSDSNLRFDNFSGTSANLFDIVGSTMTGVNLTVLANGIPQLGFDENENPTFDPVSSVIGGNTIDLSGTFSVTASDAIFFGADSENNITAQNITVSAGTYLTIENSIFQGVANPTQGQSTPIVSNATFNASAANSDSSLAAEGSESDPARLGASIYVAGSAFGFNGNLNFNGAGGNVSLNEVAAVASNLAIHADGNVTTDSGSIISGLSSLVITAGVGTALDRNTESSESSSKLLLDGSLSGGQVQLIGIDGVENTGELQLSAHALNVAGQYINLGGATITVGNGLAVVPASDVDPLLLQTIATSDPLFPRPLSSGPNAFFKAIDEVHLGTINFTESGGDYLFVRGSNFSFDGLGFTDHLLLNFTPTDRAVSLALADLGFNEAPEGLIVALGSSSYLGNIDVPEALSGGDTHFVFATRGTVTGEKTISTNGRVLVLDFSGSTSSATAASKIINQVSGNNQPTSELKSGEEDGVDEVTDSTDSSTTVQESSDDEQNQLQCT